MKLFFAFFFSLLLLTSCKKNLGDFYLDDSSLGWIQSNSYYDSSKYHNANHSIVIANNSNPFELSNPYYTPYHSGVNPMEVDCSGSNCNKYKSEYKSANLYFPNLTIRYNWRARTDGNNKFDVFTIVLGQEISSRIQFVTYSENITFIWEEETPYQYYDSLLMDGVMRKNVYYFTSEDSSRFYLNKLDGLFAFKFRDEVFFYKN